MFKHFHTLFSKARLGTKTPVADVIKLLSFGIDTQAKQATLTSFVTLV
jgi:hypothetical protein